MRLRRIALALPSYTKAQTERLDVDDSTPFIPISIPASYPVRIPMNRGLLSCARSLSSLTRPERATRISETPGCTGMRRKRGKRIPFFRCNTLSTLNLRTDISSSSDLAPSTELNRNLIETAKSVRTTLIAEDVTVKKESSKDQLSKQIKHLRSKFDSVGEENHPAVQSDSDADPTRSFTTNSKKQKNRNETKTSIMAALLIGSIRHMPLEDIESDNPSINEPLITTNNDEASGTYCRENSQENADVKDEGQRQDNASSVDETEMSSFDDDGNSSDDESSNSTTSYNILDDSRYSLDNGKAVDSSSLQERIPITVRSSAESCTDSTLQVDSDVAMNCQLSSNPDLASTEDIGLRNEAIPIITVDIHENANSNTSIELSNDETSIMILAKTDILGQKVISSSDEREIDDARCKIHTSEKFELEKIDNLLHEARRVDHLMTKHERDLDRSHPYGQSVLLEASSPAETEDHISTDRERNNPAIDLPCTTTRRASISKEELRAKTIIAKRQRCMRDLIKLIDTKMMVSTCANRHGKRIVSMRSKRKKRERKIHKRVAYTSENSLEKISSHGTPKRKHTMSRRRRREEDVSLRVPRVRSIPDYLSSDRQPISHAISRSCGSSLVNLTDHHVTRVSRGSKRAALLCPAAPTFNDSLGISRKLPKSSYGKSDTVSAVSINGGTRKYTICNLKKASCHIDRTKPTNTANITHNSCVSRPSPDLRQQDEASISPSCPLPATTSMTAKMSQSPATRTLANIPLHRRSSDSDLSVTPKGESFIPSKVKKCLLLSDCRNYALQLYKTI